MDDYIEIKLDGDTPLVAAAIHNGHSIRKNIKKLLAVPDSDRLREEDPFTGIWTSIASNRIIAFHSRFEFDLNRPPDKAVYLSRSDAWGIEVWKSIPSSKVVAKSLKKYTEIYERIREGLTNMINKYSAVIVYDLHSYNHRRNGPGQPPEDERSNPEINVGTGTMDRVYWAGLVDGFIEELREFKFFNRHLDVRENINFKGGYFPRWIHENFDKSVCCISIEVKKFFMNEWTGVPDHQKIQAIGDALKETVPGVLKELSIRKSNL